MERKDGTIWSCTAYITAIPQQLSFEPGYVLRFRYSDQKGPDINVYNKEYFDNHSSYTFLL